MEAFSDTTVGRLLIVEDDESVRLALAEGLGLDGYAVATAGTISEARERIRQFAFDLVLLDANLPDGSGYALLRELRAADGAERGWPPPDLPVMMVTGRGGEQDRIRGFEFGCDDYLVKPYSFGELRGRVAAVLRRRKATSTDQSKLGELEVDRATREVRLSGDEVKLTQKEFTLLALLAREPTRVYTRSELLEAVWGYRGDSSTRTLDAHACRLRSKLSGGERMYVVNTWGVGYRLFGELRDSQTQAEAA